MILGISLFYSFEFIILLGELDPLRVRSWFKLFLSFFVFYVIFYNFYLLMLLSSICSSDSNSSSFFSNIGNLNGDDSYCFIGEIFFSIFYLSDFLYFDLFPPLLSMIEYSYFFSDYFSLTFSVMICFLTDRDLLFEFWDVVSFFDCSSFSICSFDKEYSFDLNLSLYSIVFSLSLIG